MKRQLQGIALILFAVVLLLMAWIDPYLPVIDYVYEEVYVLAALASAVIGLVLNFKKDA